MNIYFVLTYARYLIQVYSSLEKNIIRFLVCFFYCCESIPKIKIMLRTDNITNLFHFFFQKKKEEIKVVSLI